MPQGNAPLPRQTAEGRKLTPREMAMMKGTINANGNAVRALDYKTARAVEGAEAKEYFIPAGLIAISFISFLVVSLIAGGTEEAAINGIVVMVVGVIDTVLLVAAAFATAAIFGIAFGEFKLAVLQLAAASLFSSAVDMVPFPFLGTIAFFVIVMWLMDLEFFEVMVFTVVHFIISVISFLVLMGIILSALS